VTVFVLGGAMTDFARRWSREDKDLSDGMREVLLEGSAAAKVPLEDVDATHVGNFVGELLRGQGHLGGLIASLAPALRGKAAARHEAACASGSVAILAALAELEAGFHDVCCVLGVEELRNVRGDDAARHLGAAAWVGREARDARFVWPHLFSELADAVAERDGLDHAHLHAFAKQAYDNGRDNPLAQTRGWTFGDAAFTDDDEANPRIEGRIRRQDCGQVTDGAAVVFLASERYAREHARAAGVPLETLPRILGWGHRAGPMRLDEKLASHRPGELFFPHVAAVARDARRRAGIERADLAEIHDCFSITGYVLLEHLGLTAPGRAFEAIEDGRIARDGSHPINPSGGLIGAGHPVGATGVRMLFDACRQVTGDAGAMQVEGARTAQTLNIGGSATTALSFVVGV